MSVLCIAESLTRLCCVINTTFSEKIYIRWCCIDRLSWQWFMRYVKLAIPAVSIGAGFVAYAQTPAKTGPKASLVAGRELFHQHCSVCHSEDAKGNGSM